MELIKHLNKLDRVVSNAGIKFLTPSAAPGSHCPLHTAVALSSNIKGVSTLVVGTYECGHYSRNVIPKDSKDLHWCYVLEDNEIVFGARKGLISAIEQMEKHGAKHIMIISTCVPELIGEDIEGIVLDIEQQTSSKLSFVNLPHFACNSYPGGTWKVLNALSRFIEQPKDMEKSAVNILGWIPEENHKTPEIVNVLEKYNIKMRYIAPGMEIEDIVKSSDAKLNIVLSHLTNELAQKITNKYEVPSVNLFDKYTSKSIEESYEQIFDILEIEDAIFTSKRLQLEQLEDKINLTNKRYVMESIGMVQPFPIIDYLYKFGAVPLLIHVEDYNPSDKKYIEILINQNINPYVAHMVNVTEDNKIISSFPCDFIIATHLEKLENIPYVSFIDLIYDMSGYDRSIYFLNLINSMLEVKKDATI